MNNISMNTPYRKQYDEHGNQINKITKDNPFINKFPNRHERHAQYKHRGGSKSINGLYVFPSGKYRVYIQRVFNKKQDMMITIRHALLKGKIN